MNNNDKLIRTGENEKEFAIRKDLYINVKYSDFLTVEGNIKQDALKIFQVANAMKKFREIAREFIIRAIREGRATNGVLQASIVVGEPTKSLDYDLLRVALVKNGYTLEQFYKKGEPKVRLNVE